MIKRQQLQKMPNNEIIFYQTADGGINIEVMYAGENIWLTQKAMGELFACSVDNISLHLKNIFKDGEISNETTVEDFSVVQKEGQRNVQRKTKFYSLEAIIAVGYRVNSARGIEFRQWATKILKNYIHKGFALDSNRMKYGSRFSTRYFDELYEKIKDIRTSERMIYQKITDIYATAIDYSKNALETREFFATVQNKLHFAVANKTAAEIIVSRADAEKDKMGLISWRESPNGKIMISDISIAKNYLDEKELKHLNRIGNMYLDYAEDQAERGIPMTMKDWAEKLNVFLKFNDKDLLKGLGKVSAEIAKSFAESEFEKYRSVQDKLYESDFDKMTKKFLKENNTISK
jgi:hypothetical protein